MSDRSFFSLFKTVTTNNEQLSDKTNQNVEVKKIKKIIKPREFIPIKLREIKLRDLKHSSIFKRRISWLFNKLYFKAKIFMLSNQNLESLLSQNNNHKK